MTAEDDRALGLGVWCLTCEHFHISQIPVITYACGPRCGFGVWDREHAARHATEYPDHLVHALHHQTVPCAPDRPSLDQDDDGYPTIPTGWNRVIVGDGGQILAGWTDDGAFHQYAPTEDITETVFRGLHDHHHRAQQEPDDD